MGKKRIIAETGAGQHGVATATVCARFGLKCIIYMGGFEQPDSGNVSLFNENVTDIPPFKRNVNTVFQDYALFPHMNVEENVCYSLKIKKIPKIEQESQVAEILSSFHLHQILRHIFF